MTNIHFERGAIDAGGCISNGWELVKRNLGLYVGAGLVAMIMLSCIPIVNFFLLGPVMGGFAYIVLKDMRDEPVDFGMLFKGFEKFVPLMIVGIIQAIPGIIFQIIQWTVDISRLVGGSGAVDQTFYQSGGIEPLQAGLAAGIFVVFFVYIVFQMIWNAALIFAIPLIVEHDIGVIEAIKVSFSAVFGNLGGLVVLMILGGLVGLLGFLALCFGILVAIPVVWAANVFAYRQVFPRIDQHFNMAPPPPSAYGSNFGSGM
ncbi:MAG: hypothetical protein ABL999_14090 [Pyrinomonadaceae bacterium]